MSYEQRIDALAGIAKQNIEALRPYREHEIYWAELRDINSEICDCIQFGFTQAAIALTNHFLERIMKLTLIYHEAGSPQISSGSDFETKYKGAVDKYDTTALYNNIQKCGSLHLISPARQAFLLHLTELVRNGFSHASFKKTYKDTTVKTWSASFNEPLQKPKEEDVPIYLSLFMQGYIQKNWADQNANFYYSYVFDTLEKIEKHFKKEDEQ
jgi:hypothetical protein